VKRLPAAAKINLALLVGPAREDGLHELVTVMQRIDICDAVEVAPAQSLAVDGFRKDTIVRAALERLAAAAGVEPHWRAEIRKRIPLAAGLGGGSADAAAALVLANPLLDEPLPAERLAELASGIGADDRVVISGLLSAVPGQKVEPQLKAVTAAAADGNAQ